MDWIWCVVSGAAVFVLTLVPSVSLCPPPHPHTHTHTHTLPQNKHLLILKLCFSDYYNYYYGGYQNTEGAETQENLVTETQEAAELTVAVKTEVETSTEAIVEVPVQHEGGDQVAKPEVCFISQQAHSHLHVFFGSEDRLS